MHAVPDTCSQTLPACLGKQVRVVPFGPAVDRIMPGADPAAQGALTPQDGRSPGVDVSVCCVKVLVLDHGCRARGA